nr:putative chromosome partitioning protein parB [Escherichia coli O25b:H4-ST131]
MEAVGGAVKMPGHTSLQPEAVLTEAEERLNELMARYDAGKPVWEPTAGSRMETDAGEGQSVDAGDACRKRCGGLALWQRVSSVVCSCAVIERG